MSVFCQKTKNGDAERLFFVATISDNLVSLMYDKRSSVHLQSWKLYAHLGYEYECIGVY